MKKKTDAKMIGSGVRPTSDNSGTPDLSAGNPVPAVAKAGLFEGTSGFTDQFADASWSVIKEEVRRR
jgi:hypothetical protein